MLQYPSMPVPRRLAIPLFLLLAQLPSKTLPLKGGRRGGMRWTIGGAVQEHRQAVFAHPGAWLPWNYPAVLAPTSASCRPSGASCARSGKPCQSRTLGGVASATNESAPARGVRCRAKTPGSHRPRVSESSRCGCARRRRPRPRDGRPTPGDRRWPARRSLCGRRWAPRRERGVGGA